MKGCSRGSGFVWLRALVALAFALLVTPARAGHARGPREAAEPVTPFAPPVAPGLAADAARTAARAALAAVLSVLPANDRQRLTGLYLAVDADAEAPSALAACDDDGDYVVVVNEALLTLVDFTSQLEADDEVSGGNSLSSYAELLSVDPAAHRSRVPPPPPGFFAAGHATSAAAGAIEARRYVEALEALVAHEVAHAVRGDVTCAHPTPTHEAGDDIWTPAEQRHAVQSALATYTPATVAAADDLAVRLLLRLGQLRGAPPGADPVVGATTVIEVVSAISGCPYSTAHQGASARGSNEVRDARIEALRASAQRWQTSEQAVEGDRARPPFARGAR